MSSVAMLLVAIAAPQPKVIKETSWMTPFSTLMYMRMMSPHLGFPTSPTPFASFISPTLRGLAKWSITFSLYAILKIQSFLYTL